jgi:hypothetical protein
MGPEDFLIAYSIICKSPPPLTVSESAKGQRVLWLLSGPSLVPLPPYLSMGYKEMSSVLWPIAPSYMSPNQGGRARQNFSLGWLGAAWYSSGEVDTYRLEVAVGRREFLKKLSLAGIAKLSRLKYSWLRFVWPQPTFVDAELTIGWCTQLIPQSSMKHLGLARSA